MTAVGGQPAGTSEAQPALLHLDPDEIHLWLTFYENICDDRLIRRYRQLLSPEEREQEGRFHFLRDQRRYLVTRALVRTALSRYDRIQPDEWRFTTNAYGRPAVANAARATPRLSFNISHTYGLILLGVTAGRELGVDTENVVARAPALDVAKSCFSAEEWATLRSCSGDAQRDKFFEYWTLKESYIKARGMGLSIPLSQSTFRVSADRQIAVTFAPELSDSTEAWRFWLFRPAPQYIAAVCASDEGRREPRLVMRTSIPLEGDDARGFTAIATI